jgi:hypothetical protein
MTMSNAIWLGSDDRAGDYAGKRSEYKEAGEAAASLSLPPVAVKRSRIGHNVVLRHV